MDNHNTFVVIDCKARKVLLVTSSARKAGALVDRGIKVEVWSNNSQLETIYSATLRGDRHAMCFYIDKERQYIGRKQAEAEKRNKRRRNK